MCIAVTKKGTLCTYKAITNGRCTRHHKMHLKDSKPKEACVTITFGEVTLSHIGMQQIGKIRDEGLSIPNLKNAKCMFESNGFTCELIDLSQGLSRDIQLEPASVLVVKNFAHDIADKLLEEQMKLTWDTKAKMRGRVVNTRARYNLCYSETPQEADYEKGKGTVIAYDSVPFLSYVRNILPSYLGKKVHKLNAEGNLYYDIEKCGIGWHGDSERKIVVALRLGKSMPLAYQWFLKDNSIGSRIDIQLHHGDLYVMSEKATGFDWKNRRIPSLRHAAGCAKYLVLKK